MAGLKYSKQRASIKDYLMHTTSHPTADTDRFDGRCEPHYHVVCTNCGNVFDLEMDDSYIQKINEDANKYFDGIIESHTTLFHGLCGECAKKLNENK